MEDSVINKQLPKYMKVVDKDFILHSTHVIGKGSFGKVVYGRTKQDKDICFKFEKTAAHKNSILKEELKIYTQINGGIGVPSVISYGVYKTCRYIVMELAGPSLDKYFTLCDKKFKLETVIYLGLQMVDRIEYVHNKGFIHRDIKPNNFLFGKFTREMNSGDSTVHIIDFGLSTTYLESVNNVETSKPNEYKSLLNSLSENTQEKSSEKFKAPENIINYQDDRKQNEYNIINTPINFHIKIPSCIQQTNNDNSNNMLINKDSSTSKISISNTFNNISQNIPLFRHIPYKEGARFVGTPRYASLNTHQ
jgi:serine/threonine protein kinase